MPAVPLTSTRPAPRARAWRSGFTLPALWLRRIRIRHTLAALHHDQVREAGLDAYRLRAEILKPFWRP